MRILIAVLTMLLAAVACSLPSTTPYADQWMRTPVGGGEPLGRGCVRTIFSSTAATRLFSDITGRPTAYQMPVQVSITNTSTFAELACWSQDPTPIINLTGTFRDDPLNANDGGPQKGNCVPVGAGNTYIYGATQETFYLNGPGWKPYRCNSTLNPCSAFADCVGGVDTSCDTANISTKTYLFLISGARAASAGTTFTCEVR